MIGIVTLNSDAIRYLADADGRPEAAVVPIDLWREIASEIETRHLLDNPAMRDRLVAAAASDESIPLDEALHQLGTSREELDDAVG